MGFEVDFKGLDEIELMLLKNAEAAEKYAEPILKAGAQVVADAHNKALKRMAFSKRSTGDLAGSVKPGKVIKSKSGSGYNIMIFPHGYQTHGYTRKGQRSKVSNAHAGFMLEYGTSNIPPRPWRDNADEEAAPKANEAMAAEWEKVSYG